MSSNEHSPVSGNNSTEEQIPHSGVHGYEQPFREDGTSLKDAHESGRLETPNDPSTLDHPTVIVDKQKTPLSPLKKAGIFLGGIATVAGLGLGAKSMIGGEGAPRTVDKDEVGAPAVPGGGETEAVKTPEQELRDSLTYGTEYEYFVDPKFYSEMTEYGGIDGNLEKSYIDESYAQTVVQNLLNNKLVALETGNEDAILATYNQVSPGNFGEMSGSVGGLRDQAAFLKEQREKNPSFPVGSLELISLVDVTPDPTDKNIVEVQLSFDDVSYGVDGQGNVAKYHTVDDYTWILERDDDVSGWSDGGERSNWGIKSEQLIDMVEVNE